LNGIIEIQYESEVHTTDRKYIISLSLQSYIPRSAVERNLIKGLKTDNFIGRNRSQRYKL
jgi:hypothetical protein